jgi:hypothetical protein
MTTKHNVYEYNADLGEFEYRGTMIDWSNPASAVFSIVGTLHLIDNPSSPKRVTAPPYTRAGVYRVIEEINGIERETTHWRISKRRRR